MVLLACGAIAYASHRPEEHVLHAPFPACGSHLLSLAELQQVLMLATRPGFRRAGE
jgi:hypothetical protein